MNRPPPRAPRRPRISLLYLAFLLTLLSLWHLVPLSSDTIEQFYSRGLYPLISSVLIRVTDLVPFSLSGLLLLLLPLLLLVSLIVSFRRRRSFGQYLRRWALRLLTIVVFVYSLFIVLWGANYGRQSIEVQLRLSSDPVTPAEVESLARALLLVVQTEAGAPRNKVWALASLRSSLQQTVQEVTEIRPTLPHSIKRPPSGTLILLGNASGVISPLTLEAHVEGALPDAAFLPVAVHELAHLAGYAGEADTDLMAAIAGLRADDSFARYAVALRLFLDATRELPPEVRTELMAELPLEAQRDIQDTRDAYARFTPPQFLTELQTALYDRYLRTQGVSAGIRDYSRTVQLLVRAQREGWVRLEAQP